MNCLGPTGRIGWTLRKAAAGLIVAWACAWARAEDWVTLEWDPNSEPDLGGYIVYYGVASRAYTNAINVGNVTTHTVTGLVRCVRYYFAVTAYNTNGLESDFSEEVSYLAGPCPRWRLSISSSNPAAGVRISLSPADGNGLTNGPTPFEAFYTNNVQVIVSAPSLAPNSNRFDYWRLNGAVASTNTRLTVLMNRDHAAEAVYRPTLALVCAADKTVQCGAAWDFDWPGVQAASGTATVAVVRTVTNAVGANGTLMVAVRTWRATDAAGNQAECSQTVTVRDSTPPSLSCAPDKTVECGSGWSFDPPQLVQDNCSGTSLPVVIVSTVTNQPGGAGQPGRVVRTWRATDAAGNQAECSQTVTVLPPKPPPLVLEVTTVGTESAVEVVVSPEDSRGLARGLTPLVRTYTNGTLVSVTAPLTAGPYRFLKWQRDGTDLSTNVTVAVRIESDLRLTAVYAAAGPVAWWKLDETKGVRMPDSSGSGLDGRLINGPSWTPGLLGQALQFDGSNDFVAVSLPTPLDCVTNQFTVALWFKTTNTGSQALIEKGNLNWNGLWLLALNRHGLGPGYVSVFDGQGGWLDSGSGQFTDGAWHHLAVSYDGAVLRLYCDGRLDKAQRRPVSYAPSLFPLHIGRLATGGLGWWFQGLLDDIRWYNWALPESEVARLANPGLHWTAPSSSAGGWPLIRPRITRLQFQPAYGATLHGLGRAGQAYQIRSSTNLVDWIVLGTETAGADGEFSYQDTAATQATSRFYQLVEP